MKRRTVVALALSLSLGVVGAALAGPTDQSSDRQSVVGTITAIDGKTQTITVASLPDSNVQFQQVVKEGKKGSLVFVVTDKTQIEGAVSGKKKPTAVVADVQAQTPAQDQTPVQDQTPIQDQTPVQKPKKSKLPPSKLDALEVGMMVNVVYQAYKPCPDQPKQDPVQGAIGTTEPVKVKKESKQEPGQDVVGAIEPIKVKKENKQEAGQAAQAVPVVPAVQQVDQAKALDGVAKKDGTLEAVSIRILGGKGKKGGNVAPPAPPAPQRPNS